MIYIFQMVLVRILNTLTTQMVCISRNTNPNRNEKYIIRVRTLKQVV